MTPQELKLSILRHAFQGKLVDRIFEEGTGADLLPIIQTECHNKIVAGQIKKFKVFPEITDEDIDFDVPDNWKLVRLGAICQLLDGEKRSGDAFPYLEARYLRGKTAPTIMTEGKYIAEGTNVILVDGENSGEVFHISEGGYMGSTFKVLFVPEALLLEYVIYFLQLHKNTLRNNKKGAAIPHLNKDIFFNLILPIPPFAEQERIVARIEELLPLIDRYEQAWSKLEDFNKRFPVDMQKSILQMAIQGKLVPQLPEEGTGEELYQQIQAEKQRLIKAGTIKKEKPLSEITEDEIPFDVPETWKWCRLSTLGLTQTGNTPSKAHPEYTGEDIPFITPGDILDGKIQYNNQALSLLGKEVARVCCSGSIMQVCIGGSIGKVAITEREVTFNQQINVISPIACSSKYLFAVMQSAYFTTTMKEQAGGTATPIINRGLWDSLLIPLPPLAEQKRIVAKLEEILPLCERLK